MCLHQDLEAHEARKNGGLYKTGKDWHEGRNSKAAFQAKNGKAGISCGKCNKRPCECARKKVTDARGVTEGDRPMFSGKQKGKKAPNADRGAKK